jgi:hypothetical protein
LDLKIIATPPLGLVAQGVAGLFGGGLEAQGFSPDGSQLLVKVSYSDTNYPLLALRTAFWTYDVGLGQYDACVNTLISSNALEVTDVVLSTFNGQSQLIANYRGTGADALTFNKLALIRNGVLVTDDLVAQICKNQSDAAVDAIRVSADGRFVAVETAASNLTDAVYANDGLANIYLLDLVLGTSFRITTVNGAESASNSLLGDVRVGADGALSVAFESAQAFTSASIDSNGASDAFVWRLLPANFSSPDLGTISLSSIASASASNLRSDHRGPAICRPTGIPLSSSPHGTVIAGKPAPGANQQLRLNICVAVTALSQSTISGGLTGTDGAMMKSTSRNVIATSCW